MKKVSLAILVSLCAAAGAAYAQDNGIMTSTDPAKASRCCHRRKMTSTAQVANRTMPKVQTEPSRLTAPITPIRPAEWACSKTFRAASLISPT